MIEILLMIYISAEDQHYFEDGNFIEDYRYKLDKQVHIIGLMVPDLAAVVTFGIIGFLFVLVGYYGLPLCFQSKKFN